MYSGKTPSGGRRTFGTSGLLYRSNKLMYDRQTYTLWSNLTGEPVVGRLALSPVRLEILPVTVTTWGEWKAAHPDTTVLKLDDGYGLRWNYDYKPGAAERARAGVAFPVPLKSRVLDRNADVYALRSGHHAKAYPIDRVLKERVVNDRLGDLEVVLVGDPESGAVRAWRRNGQRFSAGNSAGTSRELRDESGRRWRITEEALLPEIPEMTEGENPQKLERLPGHLSLWFAWFAFFPETEVYGEVSVTPSPSPSLPSPPGADR